MPVVTFQRPDLCRLIGQDVPMERLAERMPQIGGDLDRVEGEAVTIEWFPDRPDLLTPEGTARALRAFLDIAPGMPVYAVEEARTELRVDPAVQAVRPHAALCFVRGVPFDDRLVKAVVDAQEKLTLTMGRRRRKIAIGVHDASGVRGPFTYTAVGPDDRPFVPLQGDRPMTPAEIVASHPKGREYGHLVAGGRFPVFLDGDGEVLSMPPVINARRTTVTADTRDVLLDVTGTDLAAVRRTIALLATSLAERGGRIEAVEVHDASGTWTCPDLRPTERTLSTEDVQRLLGGTFDGDRIAVCLRRMGHDAESYETQVLVRTPPWRFDILHPVDLMEDVAIGHGYGAFSGRMPVSPSVAQPLLHHALEERLRAVMTGLGWSEARTLTLSNDADQWGHWGEPAPPGIVRLRNPVLEEQTLLRRRIVPSLLRVLAANRHRSLPQRLFEIGYVVEGAATEAAAGATEGAEGTEETDRRVPADGAVGSDAPRNRLRLAVAASAARIGFSDAKSLAEALVRDARLPLTLRPAERPGLVPGRQGALVRDGTEVGHFGELHPDVLVAFGLGAATIVVELDLEGLA